jgi:hypothetical protein
VALPWGIVRAPPTIRPYRRGDERAIVALFEQVFGRPISEDHFRWKLGDAAAASTAPGTSNVWLAFEDDVPVFHYAAIPARFRLPAGDVTAMVSVDTMTAPARQGRGLLTQVARAVYDGWREAGVPFVIGLPNERWGSRAAALGWRPLFPLRWLTLPLRPEALLARWLGTRLHVGVPAREMAAPLATAARLWRRFNQWRHRDPRVAVLPVERPDPQLDRLWQRLGSRAAVGVVRDAAWVAWRYCDRRIDGGPYRVLLAGRDGTPAGYAAFRMAPHRPAPGAASTPALPTGVIADLFADEDDPLAFSALLAAVVDDLDRAGAATVATLALPGSPLEGRLRRAGFLRRRSSFGVQIVPLDATLPMDVLLDPARWIIAGGDFDVV